MNQKRVKALKKMSVNDGHYQALKEAWNELTVIQKEKMHNAKKG